MLTKNRGFFYSILNWHITICRFKPDFHFVEQQRMLTKKCCLCFTVKSLSKAYTGTLINVQKYSIKILLSTIQDLSLKLLQLTLKHLLCWYCNGVFPDVWDFIFYTFFWGLYYLRNHSQMNYSLRDTNF